MKTENEIKPQSPISLHDRSRIFALRVIRFYAGLPGGVLEQCLGKQLLRSGTSVGAHLSEGKRSRSRAEIISKTEVALQELEESVYWMKLERISKILLESSGCELRPAASASIAIFSLISLLRPPGRTRSRSDFVRRMIFEIRSSLFFLVSCMETRENLFPRRYSSIHSLF
jgi:four helix bundle protein